MSSDTRAATLAAWGKRTRAKAIEEAGSSRVPTAIWVPHISKALERGYSVAEVAKALSLTERRIRDIRKVAESKVDSQTHLAPVTDDAELAPLLEWSTDAFAAFFERYSGREFQPHFRPWVQAFIEERNLILNVPPRHAKSTIFSVWVPIWLICRDKNVQIILVSKTSALSRQWARAVADQFTLNTDLIRDFGPFAPGREDENIPWRPGSGELMVVGRTRQTKGAQLTIQSRGSMQQILGMEADFVIIDDPTDPAVARSESQREAEMYWLQEQVLSRLQKGGRAVVIGQRVGFLDLYGRLAEGIYERGELTGKQVWHVEKYPAIKNWESKEVLWEKEWPYEELMVVYARVGGRNAFETMYQQNPKPDGGGLGDPAWLAGCRVNRMAWAEPDVDREASVRVLSVDPSPSQFHGIVLGDLVWDKTKFEFHVMACYRVKAGGLRDLMDDVMRIVTAHSPDYFIFEESGFGRWLYDDPLFKSLDQMTRVIRHKTTGVSKNHAEFGIQSLAADFEFKNISFPAGDEDGRRMYDAILSEVEAYPEGLSDILMALWFVKYNWKRMRPRGIRTMAFQGMNDTWSMIDRAKEERDIVAAFRKQKEKKRAKQQAVL